MLVTAGPLKTPNHCQRPDAPRSRHAFDDWYLHVDVVNTTGRHPSVGSIDRGGSPANEERERQSLVLKLVHRTVSSAAPDAWRMPGPSRLEFRREPSNEGLSRTLGCCLPKAPMTLLSHWARAERQGRANFVQPSNVPMAARAHRRCLPYAELLLRGTLPQQCALLVGNCMIPSFHKRSP